MRTTVKCLVISMLLVARVVAQDRPTAPPVPSEMLDGQRLFDRDSEFSIQAPDEWVWLLIPSENENFKNYSASDPSGGLGFAVNVVRADFSWTVDSAQEFQIGMAKKLRSKGFKVEPVTFDDTTVPAPNSYRFVWRVVLPDGSVMYRFGYALKHGDRIISVTCFAPEASEPARFTNFVASLRLR